MLLKSKKINGFTLIELIVIIVVVSITTVALFGVFNKTVARSADPMLNQQAIAIAQGYLEEILLKAYSDPGGPAESNRSDYDDVLDYSGLINNPPEDQFGNVLAGLDNYTVNIAINATATLGVANPVSARQINVTVTHPGNISITLIGYRASY